MERKIESKQCPHCGQIINAIHNIYANHVRWCKQNPKYETIKTCSAKKISIKKKLPRNKYVFNCVICNNEYELIMTEKQYLSGKFKKTCSSHCASKLSIINCNNNLRKNKISKTLSKEKFSKVCPYCKNEFATRKWNQICCSISCGAKYRNYNKLLNLDFQKRYRHICAFNFSLSEFDDYFTEYSDIIKEYGFYSAPNRGNNKNGVSRDHKVSVNYGYQNLIDPYIISHPANCQIIQQSKNISKYTKCSITLEELLNNIDEFNKKYGEYPNKINYDIIPEITHRYTNIGH